MLGEVNIIAQDNRQGFSDDVEGLALFIGPYDVEVGGSHFVNRKITQADLNEDGEVATKLGLESRFFKILKAAATNGGPGWRALLTTYEEAPGLMASGVAADALSACLPFCYPEFVVFTASFDLEINIEEGDSSTQSIESLENINSMHQAELNLAGTTTWSMAPIKTLPLSESDFFNFPAKIDAIRGNAPNVALVADAVPEFIGALAGRLVSKSATLADSPMRVATGPIQGLPRPLVNEMELLPGMPEMSFFGFLHNEGVAVPQYYEDFEGVYSSDLLFQTTTDSDFHVVENRRVRDKAIRLVRRQAIKRIADRRLNNTPNSIAVNKNHFIKPLREMASSRVVGGVKYPGDIQPPGDDAVQIVWESNVHVNIILNIKPYNSAKVIDVVVALDLSSGDIVIPPGP